MRSKLYISLVVVALLCLVGWTGYGQRTRQTWEYHVVPVPPGDAAGAEREINQQAAVGWELTAVGGSNYYFKRAK